MFCEKCGKQIDENSPICMSCGAKINREYLSSETIRKMTTNTQPTTHSGASSTKALGAFLIIVGIIADIISMCLIFAEGSAAFTAFTVIGTVLFFIGLALISNG